MASRVAAGMRISPLRRGRCAGRGHPQQSLRQLRAHMAPLLGVSVEHWSPGRMTHDLRRLRVHGLIERIPRSRRYRVTARGIRVALCYQRTYARVLRPTLAAVFDRNPPRSNRLQRTVETFDREIDRLCIMPSPAGLRGRFRSAHQGRNRRIVFRVSEVVGPVHRRDVPAFPWSIRPAPLPLAIIGQRRPPKVVHGGQAPALHHRAPRAGQVARPFQPDQLAMDRSLANSRPLRDPLPRRPGVPLRGCEARKLDVDVLCAAAVIVGSSSTSVRHLKYWPSM